MQYAMQDFADKAFGRSRIRLVDMPGREQGDGRIYRANVPSYFDEGSTDDGDDNDDELPLATVGQHAARRQGRGRNFDRIAGFFGGKGHLGNCHEQAGFLDPEAQQEYILDLPSTRTTLSGKKYGKASRSISRASVSSSSSLFRTDSSDADALPLPLSKSRMTSISGERSTVQNTRSPTRSPSLSRTPSLTAIQEEASIPKRAFIGEHEDDSKASPFMTRADSSSSRSSEQELPDWASAVTSTSATRHSDSVQTPTPSSKTDSQYEQRKVDARFNLGIRRNSDRSEQELKGFAKAIQGF